MNKVNFDYIVPKLRAMSKKQALRMICEEAAEQLHVDADAILRRILEKDTQSPNSTVGGGVALPFTRLLGMQDTFTILAPLVQPINFESPDGYPVDLMCLMLFPRNGSMTHLTQLARTSRLLKNDELRAKIREADSADAIRSLLIDPEGWMMAAA